MRKSHHENKNLNDIYIEKKSSATCNVSDIQQIIFGGFQSRFWMLRKHFNSMTLADLMGPIPFYSWECITLCTKERDVDIVIKDIHKMDDLLKFLIFAMKT